MPQARGLVIISLSRCILSVPLSLGLKFVFSHTVYSRIWVEFDWRELMLDFKDSKVQTTRNPAKDCNPESKFH